MNALNYIHSEEDNLELPPSTITTTPHEDMTWVIKDLSPTPEKEDAHYTAEKPTDLLRRFQLFYPSVSRPTLQNLGGYPDPDIAIRAMIESALQDNPYCDWLLKYWYEKAVRFESTIDFSKWGSAILEDSGERDFEQVLWTFRTFSEE